MCTKRGGSLTRFTRTTVDYRFEEIIRPRFRFFRVTRAEIAARTKGRRFRVKEKRKTEKEDEDVTKERSGELSAVAEKRINWKETKLIRGLPLSDGYNSREERLLTGRVTSDRVRTLALLIADL